MVSCKKEENKGLVEIRIENNSTYGFSNILIGAGNDQKSYEPLAAKAKSKYQTYTNAYRYNSIEIEIEYNKYNIVPYDFVGESALQPGKYTYQISVLDQPDKRSLDLKLIED
jgi:hypothetical protein